MLVRNMVVSIWVMEAIWKIEVENFPAFILVDDKGNDFFKQLKPRCLGNCK